MGFRSHCGNYRVELAGFGIENAIIEPGGFETNFFGNLIQPSDQSRNEAYGDFMKVPQQMGQGFGEALANNPEQKPEKVIDAIVGLLNTDKGQRPFRTMVDNMGMGAALEGYNEQLEGAMKAVSGNFQMGGTLRLNK